MACSAGPSQALPTGPLTPDTYVGVARDHMALQGHLCPEAHVLISKFKTYHPG